MIFNDDPNSDISDTSNSLISSRFLILLERCKILYSELEASGGLDIDSSQDNSIAGQEI
jgi:hypothetical protein